MSKMSFPMISSPWMSWFYLLFQCDCKTFCQTKVTEGMHTELPMKTWTYSSAWYLHLHVSVSSIISVYFVIEMMLFGECLPMHRLLLVIRVYYCLCHARRPLMLDSNWSLTEGIYVVVLFYCIWVYC